MPELVIKNGKIVLPEKIFVGDIAITSGKISKVGKNLKGDETIDAAGKYILPGLIDSHVHFREPGGSAKEDWFTGSCAAAAGGVTTVLEMPNTQPPTVTRELLDDKRKNYAKRSLVDYGFHFGASTSNIGELRKIDNVASVKFYVGSTTGSLLVESDAVLFEQMQVLARKGMIATTHAEDEGLIRSFTQKMREAQRSDPEAYSESRPPTAAVEAVRRMISFSKTSGCALHLCHISSEEEIKAVKENKGTVSLTTEATPHHLFLSVDDYKELGSLGKVNPPLRTEQDRKALWKAVLGGTIDVIATDHAPHLLESKRQGIWDAPAGVPGLETMLPLLLNEANKGAITLNEIARLTSENPAKIFRIKNKGSIKEGYDADLAMVDLDLVREVENKTLFTKCAWSPFAGRKLKGWPVQTFVRGKLVYDNGKIIKNKGCEVCYV